MAFGFGKGLRGKKVSELTKHGVVSVLEPGAEMDGKMTIGSGTARLNSHFKGEIAGEGVVLVAERGEVEAEITAKSAVVIGKVKGSLHVSERLEIRERGVVLGDIYTPVLIVEPGGYFDGQCHMPTHGAEASIVTDVLVKRNSA
ncbi:MAG: bactofilin family protein [Terriglobia bacterium]